MADAVYARKVQEEINNYNRKKMDMRDIIKQLEDHRDEVFYSKCYLDFAACILLFLSCLSYTKVANWLIYVLPEMHETYAVRYGIQGGAAMGFNGYIWVNPQYKHMHCQTYLTIINSGCIQVCDK